MKSNRLDISSAVLVRPFMFLSSLLMIRRCVFDIEVLTLRRNHACNDENHDALRCEHTDNRRDHQAQAKKDQ